MDIKKPYSIILSKKYSDKYFDFNSRIEFPYSELNKHPHWYKFEYDEAGNKIYYEDSDGNIMDNRI